MMGLGDLMQVAGPDISNMCLKLIQEGTTRDVLDLFQCGQRVLCGTTRDVLDLFPTTLLSLQETTHPTICAQLHLLSACVLYKSRMFHQAATHARTASNLFQSLKLPIFTLAADFLLISTIISCNNRVELEEVLKELRKRTSYDILGKINPVLTKLQETLIDEEKILPVQDMILKDCVLAEAVFKFIPKSWIKTSFAFGSLLSGSCSEIFPDSLQCAFERIKRCISCGYFDIQEPSFNSGSNQTENVIQSFLLFMSSMTHWRTVSQSLHSLDDKTQKLKYFQTCTGIFKLFLQTVCSKAFLPEDHTLLKDLAFTATLFFKGYMLETMMKKPIFTVNSKKDCSRLEILYHKELLQELDHLTLSFLLPTTHAVLEFVLTGELKTEDNYAVFGVRGGCRELLFFSVNAKEVNIEVDRSIDLWAGKPSFTLIEGATGISIPNPEKLSSLLLGPCMQFLVGITHLYISTDGPLLNLPFSCLLWPSDPTTFLIDHFTVSYLDSARDLLSILLYRPLKHLVYASQLGPPLIIYNVDYGQDSEDTDLFLKGSKGRIPNLVSAQVLEGKSATVSALKSFVLPPVIVHISTHGKYLGNTQSSILTSAMSVCEWLKWQPDPMLQSILAFADANTFLNTPIQQLLSNEFISFDPLRCLEANKTVQEKLSTIILNSTNILTAEAAAALKLDGSIIVLSACESRNGKVGGIIDSEGLSGLTRGFRVANSRSIVATLWEVEEEQHNELMMSFYQVLLMGKSLPEALRDSQKSIDCSALNIRDWASVISLGATEGLNQSEIINITTSRGSSLVTSKELSRVQTFTGGYIIHPHEHFSNSQGLQLPHFDHLSRDIITILHQSSSYSFESKGFSFFHVFFPPTLPPLPLSLLFLPHPFHPH
eukprot:TRINITY_DN2687_c0_g2_i3.p1 TRINITY_DN2687_c0_g2~~TRINITY_DN2687_c0_g2_i3.p1  ORF type:complete len:883 (+),score=118.00 TRINITY_DN2687_c0_g2_i3:410-3058(+)